MVTSASYTPEEGVFLTTDIRLSKVVGQVPGARWRPKKGSWHIPDTFNALVQTVGLLGHVQFSPELEDRISSGKALEQLLQDTRQAMHNQEFPDKGDETFPLYPFQRSVLAQMYTAEKMSGGGCVLAARPGTGKTVMALEWADVSKGSVLIIAPVATHSTWLRWAQKYFPNMYHARLPTSPATVVHRRKVLSAYTAADNKGVLLVTYSQLTLHSREESYGSVRLKESSKVDKELNHIAWNVVVADEAHRATSPKAATSRAAWHLLHSAPRRLVMTGTAAKSVPEESVTRLLHMAFKDGWPSWSKTIDLYMKVFNSPWGGSEITGLNPETREEFLRLRDLTMIQLPKHVAFPDLAAPHRYRWEYTLTAKQQARYEQFERTMSAETDDGRLISTFNPAVTHQRLSECALANMTLEDTEDGESSVVLTAPSPAVDALLELREHLDEEFPLLVFSASRKLIDVATQIVTEKGLKCAVLVGGMPALDREVAIDLYNTREVDFLFVSLSSAADGWSGTGGHVAVFLCRSYKPEENLQAEDRIHGANRGVDGMPTLIYDIVPTGTVIDDRLDMLRGRDQRGRDVAE